MKFDILSGVELIKRSHQNLILDRTGRIQLLLHMKTKAKYTVFLSSG